jgi:hypothetical protein
VAQRIATALAGSLTVRSEPGRGSRFTLLVPEVNSTVRNTAAVGPRQRDLIHESQIQDSGFEISDLKS